MILVRELALATGLSTMALPALAEEGTARYAETIDQALKEACPIPILREETAAESIACAKGVSRQAYNIAVRASEEASKFEGFSTPFQLNLAECEIKSKAISEAEPLNEEMLSFAGAAYDAAVTCMNGVDVMEILPTINYDPAQNFVIDQLNCFANPVGCVRPRIIETSPTQEL